MATLFDHASFTGRPMRPHQLRGLELLKQSLRQGNKRVVVQMPTGAGKCLGRGTPILMADGTIKPVEMVSVGDRLASPTGGSRTVLSLARGWEDMFRVVPVKGDPYEVNASHLLSLQRCFGGDTITLADGTRIPPDQSHVIVRADVFFASSKTARHILKGWRAPVFAFEGESLALPIPPYIVGIWLGDGSVGRPVISKPQGPVVDAWRTYAESIGLRCAFYNADSCPSWAIVQNHKGNQGANPFKTALSELCILNKKHIPKQYLTAPWSDRLELLAGLLDTDGHVSKGGYDFISKDKEISDAVCFLARSVGLAAYLRECTKGIKSTGFTGQYHRVSISGDCSIIPCRQKIAHCRQQIKRVTVTGLELHPLGMGEYFGFELDGDRLFMLGDFTVTHNTRFAAEIVKGALSKGNKVAFTVPFISLIDQTIESFALEGIDEVGVRQASHERTHYGMPVQICSVQTLAARGCPEASVVISDECHLRSKVITDWMKREPKTTFIGLSATPWARGMAEDWQDLVIPVRMQELIDQKYLSPFRVFAPTHPDLTGIRTLAGDYHEGDLSEVMGDDRLVADIVQTWLKLGNWEPTLVFAVDRAHAAKIQAEFQACGVPMGYCDAFVDRVERRVLFDRMERRDIAGIVNVGTLTTGVDADVRCIVIARPTKSDMLHCQIIGRALRTAPGKTIATIIDHSDNHARLGFVTDIHHTKLLAGKEKNPTAKEKGEALPKECPICSAMKPPKVSECPECGFKPTRQSDIETESGELVEITKGAKKKPTMPEKQEFWSMAMYVDEQRNKGGKLAKALYRGRYDVWPKGLDDTPKPPDAAFLSYETSRRIAYAKAKGKAK